MSECKKMCDRSGVYKRKGDSSSLIGGVAQWLAHRASTDGRLYRLTVNSKAAGSSPAVVFDNFFFQHSSDITFSAHIFPKKKGFTLSSAPYDCRSL